MHRCLLGVALVLIAGCGAARRDLSPIRLEPIVTLGATSGDGAIATTPNVSARHPGGFRIVIPAASAIGTSPLVFGDTGAFLGTLRGDGTTDGTFSGAMFARFGPGDSIWVFDNSGRILGFDSQRAFGRARAWIAGLHDAIVLGDGRMVVSSDSAGPLGLFDTHGALTRPIGAQASGGSLLLPAADGTFWATSVAHRWRLTHWDTTGTRLGEIEPQAQWFQSDSTDRVATTAGGPAPRIVAAWIDASNRLWVVGEVADPHWSRAVAEADGDRYYDSIVEVRDLITAAVIATARFDNHYSSRAEPGTLVHTVRTSAGWQRAELMRVVFTETSRP